MWIYNSNFGKWSSSSDNLTKTSFDLLKQELSATRFYSRILSGATFIPVNDLDNIYDILGEWEPRNWYVNSSSSQYSETMSPTKNAMNIDSSTSYEYYTKFIAEYGLTLKTLFTADRLIKDSISNYYHVDVATTEQIDLYKISNAIVMDGVLLRNGHKILVKDQKSTDTITGDMDAATYFTGEYTLLEDLGGTRTYEYYNNENGIYVYNGKTFVKDSILDDYSNCVRYSVHVGLGTVNAEKQFHLKRLLNGYFPTSSLSEPMTFIEKHNWMLRNRVDYNNLFEINYFDVIKHGTQSYQIEGVTYSIPPRTIAVGEFGVILNTQNLSGLQGTSNIINNKYKVNLRSISQTATHYWVCGDDSILLKVRKHDFLIERAVVDTLSNLTSVSFFNDLRGAVVGDFNSIFITTNGGQKWNRLKIADFAPYTYNKVLFTDANRFYVGGRNGVFLEMYEDQSGWTALKRRIFKEIDDDDEYLLVEGINDLYKTTISTWGLSYSFGSTQTTATTKDLMFIATNNGNLITYDMTDATEFDFLYLDFGKNYGDIRNVTRQSGTDNFYFTAADGLYSFDINNFKYIGVGNTYSNTIAGTYATIKSSLWANEIFDYEENELIIAGNNSLLKTTNYGTTLNFKLLDDNFEDRLKSKLLFMDYDIGAKLNWFTDQGEYRMPNSITFSTSLPFKKNADGTLSSTRSTEYLYDMGFGPIIYGATAPSMLTQSECNWLTYWIDSQKTFEYYSRYPLNEYAVSGITGSMVLISTTFSYASEVLVNNATPTQENKINLYKGIISNDLTDIIKLAPSFAYSGTQSSRYDKLNRANISAPTDLTPIKLYLYDYLMILKVPTSTHTYREGDVARIESGIVDTNLIVNKTWVDGTSTYVYMYSEFNQTIITDFILNAGDTLTSSNVSITNLNRYKDIDELVYNFNLHPIGNAYKMQITGSASYLNYDLKLTPKFNNLTSYYNLATNVYFKTYKYQTSTYGNYVKDMIYTSGFLKFGYTATYNLLDYLESINKVDNGFSTFYASKEYLAMPIYKDIPLGSLGSSNIYIDSNGITQSSTTGNKIMFGEKLKLEWESILLNTFVDVYIYQPDAGGTYTTERLLVMHKYKIENIDDIGLNTYVIEFHKKLNFQLNTSLNDGTIDIVSRRSLLQISNDLQEMNNIHKAKLNTKHIVNDTLGYNNYQSELNFKIPTDSYAKIFLSDVDTVDSLSAVMYVDYKNELAMNITRLDRDFNIPITNTVDFGGKLFITCSEKHKLSKDDGIILDFNGGSQSSAEMNQNYFGYRVVTQVYGEYDFAVELPYGNEVFVGSDSGYVRYVKKDPFLNYQPVDLIDIGLNKKGKIAIELGVENTKLTDGKFGLVNVDFNKYRFRLVDGLNIETISLRFPWILEAEVSGAVIGMDQKLDLVWYKGIWEGGRWFGGTWISGTWKLGDWYAGSWNSKMIKDKQISVEIDKKSSDEFQSTWYTGRWFGGTWNNGTWINGRFYDGDWNAGVWNNGTWNDGTWNGGRFIGGIWVTGEWNGGIFNTDNEPAYWIDGVWNGGDFENGMWYNGSFESKNTDARFGTKAYNSRTATWHGGKWLSGSFFSKLGTTPDVSDVHKYSIWHTGQWISGDFYGGIAYNIDFKSGTWHGGILEDIQIIGMNENNNSFILNGIFKFNIGDEFYIIDNNVGNELSVFYGNNDEPKKYIVLYATEDAINEFTEVYVATNVTDFSGRFVSYKKEKTGINATFSTNSIITNTITTTGVRETIKDVKVKINLIVENKLIEKYTPVAQYKVGGSTDPLGTTTWEIPLGTSPGVIIPPTTTNPYPGLPLYDALNLPKSVAVVPALWYLSSLFVGGLIPPLNTWNKVGNIYVSSTDKKKVTGVGTFFLSQVAVGSDIYLYKGDPTTPFSASTFAAPYLLGRVASITSNTELNLVSDFVPLIFISSSTTTSRSKSFYFYDYTIGLNTNFKYTFRCNTNNGSNANTQIDFLSQNLIGVRKSDSLGVIKVQWGFTPNGYNGPGYSSGNGPMVYTTNSSMIASYGNTYVTQERVLDPISLNEISSTTIATGTTYSTSDEIYGYRIDISEDHLFGSYFLQYEVGLVYEHTIIGLLSDRYYYFRILEIKSSGIGGLRINLTSPNGQTICLKEFNEGNDDTNMIDTVLSYNQNLPMLDSGKPIYEGDFKMNLGTQSELVTMGQITVGGTRLTLSSWSGTALFLESGVMSGSKIYAITTVNSGGTTIFFEKYLGVVKNVSNSTINLVSATDTSPFVEVGSTGTVPFATGTTYYYRVDKYSAKCDQLVSEDLNVRSLISKNIYADFTNLVGTTQYANGDWTLSIENTSGVNIGHLQNWEIQFGYSDVLGAQLYDKTPAIDTGLKIVSSFKNANWKTGIWTNGIFDEGIFETGIWYNGVFNGTWG
jgi:subtilisin-like proprotein convertase family protein